MTKSILSVLLCLPVFISYCQLNPGDIEIRKSFGGIKFYQEGELLPLKEVQYMLKSDPEAYAEFRKAKANYNAANVFGFIGGFMIGWPIGSAIGGGDPQWGLAAGGVGVLLLSIPFNKGFSNHSRNAIEIYNGVTSAGSPKRYYLSIHPQGSGAKVILRF